MLARITPAAVARSTRPLCLLDAPPLSAAAQSRLRARVLPELALHGALLMARYAVGPETQQRTSALMQVLGNPGDKVQPFAAKGQDQVTDCAGLSVSVRPAVEQVQTRQVLLGFALWHDGSFIINIDTAVMQRHEFVGLKPDDTDLDAKQVQVLLNRQPTGFTVATPTVPEQADADRIRRHGDDLLAQLNYSNIRVSNTAVLGEPEIKAIESRGFPRATWQFVVLLNNRV